MMLALLGGVAVLDGRRRDRQSGRQLPRDRTRRHPRHPGPRDPARGRSLILAVVLALAIWFTKRPFGRTIIALGDNPTTARYSGARELVGQDVARSSSRRSSATLAGVLLVGYAGVHPASAAATSSPRSPRSCSAASCSAADAAGSSPPSAGAFALEALFTLLNFAGVPSTLPRRGAGRHHHRSPSPTPATTVPRAPSRRAPSRPRRGPPRRTSFAGTGEGARSAQRIPLALHHIPSTQRADNETKGGS